MPDIFPTDLLLCLLFRNKISKFDNHKHQTTTNPIMKKHCFRAVAALGLAAAVTMGCTESQELTSKKIVKEVNASIERAGQTDLFVDVTIGHYECNSPAQRMELAQLEAAGLIKYEVTRYAWWEKEQVSRKKAYQVQETRGWYYTWTETVTRYKWVKETVHTFEDHYVVDVTLTRAGERLLAERPEPEEFIDEDLVSKEVDPSTYKWNKVDLSESWPEIPNPFLTPVEPEEPAEVPTQTSEPETSTPSTSTVVTETETTPVEDPVERIDKQQYEAYNAQSFYSEVVTLKAGSVKAIKARNIIVKEEDGAKVAEAEVIYETYGATDAGRIIANFENGRRSSEDYGLIYYLDKGWVLSEGHDYDYEH